ncbi:MAG TPA: 50S ribosomal protein L6 [Phycisphaerae bacterium]|nr:50S ribosomal protein L6 [Phycisphaerae bacterium]
MSRIGKKPVAVPSGVKVEVANQTIKASGPKGELAWRCPDGIAVAFDSAVAQIQVTARQATSQARALHGLSRALIANMVRGVHQGYRIGLEIYGTGYGCRLQGRSLLVNCGYMGRGVDKQGKPRDAQFNIPIPEGLTVTVEVPAARGENEPAKMTIEGADKQKVGQFAAEVRAIRPPEPYKGKGIRYAGEQVRRKQGKAFASGSGG